MATSPNILLASPDYMGGVADGLSVTPVLYGGSWQVTAPLANLQSRFLSRRARSNGCSLASTQFVIDLGMMRAVYAVAIPKHNGSKAGAYTFSVYTDAALVQMVGTGSGLTAPPIVAWGTVPWEHPSAWDGQITDEDYALNPPPLLVVLGANVIGRYIKVELQDTANPAGYLEVCRPIVAPGYQPSLNVEYGASIQINDPTIVTTSLGGALMFDQRPRFRSFHGDIKHLPTNEAFANVFDMYWRAGVSLSGFFCLDPTDTVNLSRNSFPATFAQLDPLTITACGYTGITFMIKERKA